MYWESAKRCDGHNGEGEKVSTNHLPHLQTNSVRAKLLGEITMTTPLVTERVGYTSRGLFVRII
ncbi:hypothetical protein FRX31_023278 [Thalictrum thalictroides]|uniref:Uncharacterized protein n=1 Tax=Thalictrum thalictroides TaxID=46969 RepID=A0A7J6VSJ1_THATH|nr:hypothetical protein FRX31_023278 [Thalictrum thalictroides]